MTAESAALLSAVVVQWGDTQALARLLRAWPDDPRFELVVVDQGGDCAALVAPLARARVVRAERNLGFAGGVNLGLQHARSPFVLLLNPDTLPGVGSLELLLAGFDHYPQAAGLVPALAYPEGGSQCRWQLRPVPNAWHLLAQTWFLAAPRGFREEPPAGTPIGQPAAAALCLRRSALAQLGGLDAGFFPAWFEDVDLAKRAQREKLALLYWPKARFEHAVGSTLPTLGYRAFLWLYYRNLLRYTAKHHVSVWHSLFRISLTVSPLLRLLALPLRPARRATSRRQAARGLLALSLGALSGFRWPRGLCQSWLVPDSNAERAHAAASPERGSDDGGGIGPRR